MQNNLVMTSSPHLRDHSSTQRIKIGRAHV